MKKIILLSGLLSFTLFASTFSLTNNQSGETYLCAEGGGVTNPSCVNDVNDFCDFETSFSDNECFTKSTRACRTGATAECVKDVFSECDFETSLSDNECFDESTLACGGSAQSLRKLIRSAKSQTEKRILNDLQK